ncbi:MAG: EamA family transporter [Cyclobacteriaceae bacterium]|nr:EamA family transporter [Cyclobacteriaceae bacterium]
MEQKNSPLAILLMLILALIWGTSFILMKRGLVVFQPQEVAALRVTIAGIVLLPLAILKWKLIKKEHISKLFISGMLGVFIPAFLFVTAQQYISSSVAGILNTLSPLWTMVMGVLFFHVVFKRSAVFGVLIGLAGATILMVSRSPDGFLGFNAAGLLIVVACAFYGVNLNFIKFKISDLNSLTITSISVVLLLPLALFALFFHVEQTTEPAFKIMIVQSGFIDKLLNTSGGWKAFGFVALLAFMSTAVAVSIFNKLVKMTTPLFASSVTYLMPIVSVMWGVFDGEVLTVTHFIGMAAILSGVYLANRK